jgi:hydroxymethylpyrimidine/phosphomethylpyrimidine kinase
MLRKRRDPPVVLTVAGFDPSSGAGATADLKTIAAHGCYGVACLTALTVQSSRGVRRILPVPAPVVAATLRNLAVDVRIAAVKIGMLATGPAVSTLADFLRRHRPRHVVLDPILKSTSGARLLNAPGRRLLLERLLPLTTVVTPNLDEAAALTGDKVSNVSQMKAAARRLHQLGARNVVVTGGHLARPLDVLSMKVRGGIRQSVFSGKRTGSRSTHGTGCAFSSALASNLAMGKSLPASVRLAKQYVARAMRTAYRVGKGASLLDHIAAR